MRRRLPTNLPICTLLAVATALAGCSGSVKGSRQPDLYDTPNTSARRDAPKDPERYDPDALPVSRDQQMQQLASRLHMLENANEELKQKLSDQYMEALALKRAQIEAKKNGTPEPTTNTGTTETTDTDNTTKPAPAPAPKLSAKDLTQLQLVDALVDKIIQGEDPDRVKALAAAALSIASNDQEIDPRLLAELDPREREQVARFHQMLAVVYDELATDKERVLTRREMLEKIDDVFGAQPLSIQTLELCRRVEGYGVYETFASTRFLAGRRNRVLIYVELENFHHEPTDDGQYEVRLEQQVELYDATGEATVWRQGPVELVDVSRNKRRDFFVVYPVDLPARLTAGAYRLKVRLADKHTGSICEKTMHDLRIVADAKLVDGK